MPRATYSSKHNYENLFRASGKKLLQYFFTLMRLFRFKYSLPSPNRILIVKTHAIGDVILVTPAIRAIKKKYPDASLYALVGNWSSQVLEKNPNLESVISFDDKILFKLRIFKLLQLVRQIRKYKFNWAFIFQPSIFVQTLIWFAGIPCRIGFDNKGSGINLTHRVEWNIDNNKYIAANFLELPKLMGADTHDEHLEFSVSDEDKRFAKDFILSNRDILDKGSKIIGLCPGGGSNPRDIVIAKLWHIDKYGDLLHSLIESDNVRFILFGSKSDKLYIDRLVRYNKADKDFFVNACSKTSLKQMAALFQHCSMIITNDSAPLHIAIALNVPSLSIFGPTNPNCLIPKSDIHVAVQSSIECSPCYHNSPFPGCLRIRCMELLTVEQVLFKTRNFLKEIDEKHYSTCL